MDQFLIYVCGVSVFAIIWLFYGLINQKARPQGLGLVGYVAVAASVVMTIFFFGVSLYR
ncbi:MAG TPA: hypothetical protein VHV31_05030 [Nitrolancea sp.]|jgi:hypothetical protein|nr:hypothetical protein [Nitrolancea sp.]